MCWLRICCYFLWSVCCCFRLLVCWCNLIRCVVRLFGLLLWRVVYCVCKCLSGFLVWVRDFFSLGSCVWFLSVCW